MFGFFSKKRIFKDNQECLTDLKQKSDLSLNKIPSNSINLFKELDITKTHPLEQIKKILEIYKESFQNLSKTIDGLDKELDDHILFQRKKSNSFKKNQEKYKQELEFNTCEHIIKKLNPKIIAFKEDLFKTQKNMTIFVLFSEQLELFINQLRSLEKEYDCEFNKLQNDFNPILTNIKRIQDIKDELSNLLESYVFDDRSSTFVTLKKQITNFSYFFSNLIKTLDSLESFFKKLYAGLEDISSKHLSEFLERIYKNFKYSRSKIS